MIDFINNHLIESLMILVAFAGSWGVVKHQAINGEKKMDNLSNEIGGIKDTLHLIQIENTRTSERTLNTQEQLKEIKEQLKDINKGQNAKNN